MLLRKGGDIQGIIAGEIKPFPIQFQIGYKRWQGPSLRTLMLHRYAFLGNEHDSYWGALERHLEKLLETGEAEAVLLRDFELHQPPHTLQFHGLPGPCKYRTGIVQEHWFVENKEGLTGHKRRHPSFWKHVRNARDRISNHCNEGAQIRCYLKAEELDVLLKHTEWVALRTWQRRLGGPDFTSDEVRDRFGHFASRGLLRARILYIGNKPGAFLHGLEYVGNFYAEVMGYDPAHSGLGVGTYLTGRLLENIFEEGIDGFVDFGVGNSEAKRRFCDNYFKTKDLFLVAPQAHLMALNSMRVASLGLHFVLKKALSKSGLYHKVRSAWRSGAGTKRVGSK